MSEAKINIPALYKRLEALPGLQDGAKRGGRYRTLLKRCQDALTSLSDLNRILSYITPRFPAVTAHTVEVKITDIATRSSTLAKRLTADADLIVEEKTELTIISIVDSVGHARASVENEWKTQVGSKFPPRQSIARVLEHVLPKEGPKIKRLVDTGTSLSTTIPKSAKDAEKLEALLQEIDTSFENIGLKGEVGNFLRDCASESGAPLSKLGTLEIKKFIEANNLSAAFKVKMG